MTYDLPDILSVIYCQYFAQSVLKKGILVPTLQNLVMRITKKELQKLIKNPESFTSAFHVIVYRTEPLPWQLPVAMAPSMITKTSHRSQEGILRSKYLGTDALVI